MNCLFVLLLAAFLIGPQSSNDKSTNQADPVPTNKVDAKLHADAVRLVEGSGARQRLQDSLKPLVAEGRKQMDAKCPQCSSKFGDEWEKRMLERLNVNDFLAVYVSVYEKYLTDAEITELIALQKASKDGPPPTPSPALKQKLESVMPSLMGDAMGGCATVGAKLGSQIGQEIEREHPEYLKAPDKDPNKDENDSAKDKEEPKK